MRSFFNARPQSRKVAASHRLHRVPGPTRSIDANVLGQKRALSGRKPSRRSSRPRSARGDWRRITLGNCAVQEGLGVALPRLEAVVPKVVGASGRPTVAESASQRGLAKGELHTWVSSATVRASGISRPSSKLRAIRSAQSASRIGQLCA